MPSKSSLVLENKVKILSGYPFASQLFSNQNGMPLIRIRDLLAQKTKTYFSGSYLELYVVHNGDILIGMDGDFNIVRWQGEEALLNQRVCKVISISPDIDKDFLFYWLQPSLRAIEQRTSQTTVRHLSTNDIEQIPLPSLSPSEQCLIADILDTLDTQIQQTETFIAKLKQVKIGLLHDLLTRGIDENGEVRDPVAHPEEFQEVSFLQKKIKIPAEWEIKPLNSLLIGICAGKSPRCPDQPAGAGEWGVLKVSAVHPTGFRAEENKVIINPAYINTAYEVHDGDLLMSRANTYELVGMVCLVRNPRTQLLLCDKTLRLQINTKNALSEFIFYMLQMPFMRSQIEMHATGSSGSMKNISQNSIKNLAIYASPLEEQKQIIAILEAQDMQISTEEAELTKLKQLKKGLMDDLLAGRVRVTELITGDERLNVPAL